LTRCSAKTGAGWSGWNAADTSSTGESHGAEYPVERCRDLPELERALREHAGLTLAELIDN
jgi:hypothetical protein